MKWKSLIFEFNLLKEDIQNAIYTYSDKFLLKMEYRKLYREIYPYNLLKTKLHDKIGIVTRLIIELCGFVKYFYKS